MPDIDDFSDLPTPPVNGSSDAGAVASAAGVATSQKQPAFVAPAPEPTPSDNFWDQQAGSKQAMLREVLRIQSAQSPDAAAKASTLSRQTGIPEDVAARNPQEAASAAIAQHANDLATKHPELAQWITAPRNAALAHDDLPVLKTLDHTIQAIQNGRNGDLTGTLPHGMIYTRDGKILEPMPGGLANEYDSLQAVAIELRLRGEQAQADEIDRQQTMEKIGNPLYLGRFGRLLEQGLQAAQQSRGVANPEVDSSMHALNEAYPDESGSIPTGLARLAGGLAGQGPELLLGGELAPIAASLYDVSKAKSLISTIMSARAATWAGRGAETAAVMAPMNAVHALEQGRENNSVGAGLTDFIASSGIVAATGPVGAAKLLLPMERAGVARGTMPVFQHILKDAGLMGTQNAAMVLSQALENRVFGSKVIDSDQLFHDMIANGELGAVAGGLFALGPAVAGRYHREATAAAGSLESADQLRLALQQLRDSKLNKRAPEDMQAAMDSSLSASNADRHVYLQSEDWQAHWNAQGVDPVAKARQAGAEASFSEAQATGGTMAVKLSSYLQTLADSKTGEELIAKTRMAPGAMTPEEAGKWHQTAPDQIEQLYRQGAADAAGRDAEAAQHPATDEIYQSVKEQIARARPHWPEATLDAVSRVYARTLSGIARFATPEGAAPIDPRTLHESISIGSELPESLRSRGFDAIKSLMERIHSGEGTATPEEEAAMADLSQHAEAIGGAVDQHTLDNIQGMMRDEASRTLGQQPMAVHRLTLKEAIGDTIGENYHLGRPTSTQDLQGNTVFGTYQKRIGGSWVKAAMDEGIKPGELDAAFDRYSSGKDISTIKAGRWILKNQEMIIAEATAQRHLADNFKVLERERGPTTEDEQRISDELDANYFQGGTVSATGQSLAFPDLLKQWRKANGDRTPARGSQEWQKLVEEASLIDAANGKTYEQPAYHGTGNSAPYDRFDYNKVGGPGGEGAQAYGHGIYLAGKKEVAQYYKDKLGAGTFAYNGKQIDRNSVEQIAAELLHGDGMDIAAAVDSAKAQDMWYTQDGKDVPVSRLVETIKAMDPNKLSKGGKLYTVDIPEDKEYLQWDKPLSEQPEHVKAAIEKIFKKNGDMLFLDSVKKYDAGDTSAMKKAGFNIFDYPGAAGALYKRMWEIYIETGRAEPARVKAARLSKDLSKLGVPGIQYLDQMSRGVDGEKSSNYVIFDDNRIKILQYEQPSRGGYSPLGDGRSKIALGPNADPSTVIHELGHYALDTLAEFAAKDTASASLKRDMQTLYDHIGIKDQAEWSAMDFDQRRAAHEKFAESFESYFMEGKAPSPELRGVFRKIRNLMVGIYRTLKPLINLTPEVRNVFDRLLEADTKMGEAREEMGAKPLFRSAEEAGMGSDEFAAYLRDITAETEQDRARLMDHTMRDVARRLTDNWKAEEVAVRADQQSLVNRQPEFRAMLALQSGKWPEGLKPEGFDGPMKLDRADLVQRYSDEGLKELPGRAGFSSNPNRGSPVYAKEGGLPLEAAATMLGFRSGDELWQALTQSGNRTMEIDRLTRKEMDLRHPDPVQDGSLEQDAIDVLHGASQAKRIMRELDSLARPVGQAPPPIEVLRQVAQRKIAERDVRAINPEVYRRAEAKATREVMEALAKQDRVGAYQAQVRRVLSSEMYRAAADAKQAINDGVDFVKKFSDRRVREILGKAGGWEWTVVDQSGKPLTNAEGNPAKFDTEEAAKKFSVQNDSAPYLRTSSYLGQIDSLRERFGFVNGNPSRIPEALDSFIREMADRGAEVVVPEWIADTGDRMSWRDLNFSQFQDVIDTLSNIEHLGRNANKLSEELGKGLLEQKLAGLTAVSDANKQRVRNRPTTPGVMDKALDMVANWDAMLTRLSTQIHTMDGFKEGGEWWETFVRPLQECATKEGKMQAADAEELKALADAAGYNDQSGWVYRREYIPEINDHQSHMGRLMIAAYYGRQEGRERLLTAHWTDDQIHRLVLDRLTTKDRDFLHGVWRMFDKKFPDLRALEQRLSGITVQQSEALPFRNAAGVEFKGGYIPIKYDPRSNTRAEALVEATNAMEQKRGAFGRAKTRDSMVKQTAQTTGMKLRLDEGVIFQGLAETNHRLAHQDVLTDLAKIISNKSMAETIRINHGIDAFNLIRDTLTDVAGGDKENLGALGKVMHHFRTGVPAAAFGFNAMRAFLDIAESLPQAVARVQPIHLASAVGKMLGNAVTFQSFAKSIAAKSSVMADRQRTDLRMAADAFKGARVAGKVRASFDHAAQSVMHQAHLFTDHLVWQAAYDQSLAQGHAEAKAIALADSITQDTQSSARTMDLSKFQRGSEFHKMLTVAYGFFGSVYQLQKTIGLRGARDIREGNVAGGMARMFTNYICLYSLPIAIDLALKSYLRSSPNDKPKEAGEIAWELGKEHLAFALGTMPVARELGGAFTGHMGYSGPAGERGVTALYGVAQSMIHSMDRLVEGKESAPDHPGMSQTERSALMAAGIIFHLPAVQTQRTVDGIAYAMENGTNPIIPALAGKPPKHK